MPPGNDALATYFKASRARRVADPKVSEDINVARACAETSHVLSSEPQEVIYAEEDGLTFRGPSLWCIPLSARTSPNVILYFHGGGFITNSPSSHRKMVGHIAKAANMQALLIDYRMAPEHKYPAYLDDALDSWKWLLNKGYKAENIVTMGDSAGGNLCTALPLKLRESGQAMPKLIVPISPWYDLQALAGTMESNLETDALIGRKEITGIVSQIYQNEDAKLPMAHLLDADPKGLPPMYIVVGGYETLRDNGEKFAEKAKAAGVDVQVEVGETMQHVYTFMAGRDKNADTTIANIGKWISEKLS